jgi:uncharacterized protein (TIGR02246 family)
MTAIEDLLAAWKKAIDAHHPAEVAALFTEDAVFQGLHPYTVGQAGVADYYAGQPAGMTAAYRILETRPLADAVVLGWVAAAFSFTEPARPPVEVNLTVVAHRDGGTWRIAHYHVSPRIPSKESPSS